jgi:hypothetical protein
VDVWVSARNTACATFFAITVNPPHISGIDIASKAPAPAKSAMTRKAARNASAILDCTIACRPRGSEDKTLAPCSIMVPNRAAVSRSVADNIANNTEATATVPKAAPIDGPMNPGAEGIDIAVTAFPASFDNVADEFLWPLRRSLFASRQYLSSYRPLNHPRQLEEYRCLVYQPTGPSWPFLSRKGAMTVTVQPRMSSNDMSLLLEAAKTHLGVALLSNYVALADFRGGSLVVPLPDFPVPALWIKAMVPIDRLRMPRVNALLHFIRSKGGGADSLDERSARSTAKSRKK